MDISSTHPALNGSKEHAGGGRVQVIDRSIVLLRTLAGLKNGASALDLARLTGIDRSTIHRLLKTLTHWSLIESQGATYRIGPESLIYSAAYLNRMNLRKIALPYAIELQRVIGERQAIVSLSIPVGDQVVLIERMWTPTTPLNVIVDLADQYPIDGSPSGRAVLSTYNEEAALNILGQERYAKVLPALKMIRTQQDFAFGHGEFKPGLSSVAFPIRLETGMALGAVVVAGLGMEDETHPASPLASHVRRACEGIAAQLGNL
ncbi:helix-turn-helix domain-containing protein [Pseudomonas cichorii]|uniref:IclR family transcriptional regulator n=1 Tax=Pseudomonas cichorii TaxID=36746 RepID=UPI0018E62318|nr:helix-turn-helix domain-containing protein [Pseudomonas cichorii]MBI6852740.1 helix-turn-helix domain-containing protein [Pseudomonas cichorii]